MAISSLDKMMRNHGEFGGALVSSQAMALYLVLPSEDIPKKNVSLFLVDVSLFHSFCFQLSGRTVQMPWKW